MKYVMPAIAVVAILLIASCNKDTPTNTSAPMNGWTFKGNTYYNFISKFNGNTLATVEDTTVANYHTLSFTFPSVPTTDGTYRVINHATTPTGNQVTLSLSTYGFPSVFNSLGNDSVNATVTVNNGKVTVSVPAVNLLSSTTAIDTSILVARVTQTQ